MIGLHIVEDCPVRRFPSGLPTLYLADDNAIIWLDTQSDRETSVNVVKGTGPISRTPALMGNYGKDSVLNEEYSKP